MRIMEKTTQIISYGENINYWNDNWLGKPFTKIIDFPLQEMTRLPHQCGWPDSEEVFPNFIANNFPNWNHKITHIHIPWGHNQCQLVWTHLDNGILIAKEAHKYVWSTYFTWVGYVDMEDIHIDIALNIIYS